jgi:erythronate-4-phosphate dehydrogenase
MKVVCATSVLNGEAAFSTVAEVVMRPETAITREDLHDADALICRSKLPINEALLHNTGVRFVGCAVAGIDHVDLPYLHHHGIAFAHAPGCNANSVAEYILTALFLEAERHQLQLDEHWTLGLIGVGHIGTRVAEKALDIGIRLLLNDPPRAARGDRVNGGFVELDRLLAESDAVSLHVPLITAGDHPTYGLADTAFFRAMKPGALFFNAARGEVMRSAALREALDAHHVRQAVLDVWENEPGIDADLMQQVDIATPHIAGYSHEGRQNGTAMVYERFCEWLEEEPVWLESDPVQPDQQEWEIDAAGRTKQDVLNEMVQIAYPLLDDDRHLRSGASSDPERMAAHFTRCRQTYPTRHEFSCTRFVLRHADEPLLTSAWELGFQISEA